MSTWYYYDNNGQKQGPVTGGQLKWLAKNGKIFPETSVETESGKTAKAGQVQGLTFVEPTLELTLPPPDKVEVAPPDDGETYGVQPYGQNPFALSALEEAEMSPTEPPVMASENPFSADIPVATTSFADFALPIPPSTPSNVPPSASPFVQPVLAVPLPTVRQLFCTNCGKPIAENATACMACGTRPTGYKKFCRQCGVALNPEQIVCVKCGSSLGLE